MQERNEESVERVRKRLPLWVSIPGGLLIAGTAALAIRLTWERTLLTWRYGPQMVGFALAHGPFIVLVLAPLLLALWLLSVLLTFAIWKIRHRDISRQAWAVVAAAIVVLGTLFLPQSFFDTVFASQLAKSPRAHELMVYAAGEGEHSAVRRMLKCGVPVGATDQDGSTALHTAAGAGQTELVSLLLKAGADVNAVNLYGDSPLLLANENHRDETAKLLTAHGGRVLRGDQQKRDRATAAIVKKQIEEQDRERRAAGYAY